MKKIVKFIKLGVRNNTRKSVTEVQSFESGDVPRQSHVDSFGRVVDGPGISKTHYVRSRTDRNEDRKSISDWRPSNGIHTMDPSDILALKES